MTGEEKSSLPEKQVLPAEELQQRVSEICSCIFG